MEKRPGFTLLELIIAMAVISVVMAGVFMAFSMAMKVFMEEASRTDVYIGADHAVSVMTKELKGAREIVSASSREVSFWLSDLNDDGTREANETIIYLWSTSPESSLKRFEGVSYESLAFNVMDFELSYDNPSAVGLIKIKLAVGNASNIVTLESSVKPRNL